ncbi:hypothetical protein OUZ56_002737 [Daphnia magna]|uniref:Uncharacterized protein n=1 Tax=Daphnia magna TaxID=35525 RepID=A0ABR0A6Q4_9CRUS|nr:hypothetical protein OUZ56_002737 [Daphnia magna]
MDSTMYIAVEKLEEEKKRYSCCPSLLIRFTTATFGRSRGSADIRKPLSVQHRKKKRHQRLSCLMNRTTMKNADVLIYIRFYYNENVTSSMEKSSIDRRISWMTLNSQKPIGLNKKGISLVDRCRCNFNY